MLSISLASATEKRLAELAEERGQTEADVARDLIEASIDDLDDLRMALSRLETPQVPLTSEQAWKTLGLDD